MAAQGPSRSRGDAVGWALPEGLGGPLEEYRNPARQHLAFFHAAVCQGAWWRIRSAARPSSSASRIFIACTDLEII